MTGTDVIWFLSLIAIWCVLVHYLRRLGSKYLCACKGSKPCIFCDNKIILKE